MVPKRQRLIFRGASLDDDDKLDSPLELDLAPGSLLSVCIVFEYLNPTRNKKDHFYFFRNT